MSESSARGSVRSDERARRFEADRALVAAVRKAGGGSPEFRYLQEALSDVVVGTLTNLSKQGKLFAEVKRQCRISLHAPPSASWREDSRGVIFMSAATAIPRFMRDFVLGGRWSPERGSSLKTTAVKAGLYSFVEEYRAYCREEAGRVNVEPLGALSDEDFGDLARDFGLAARSRSPDPEDTAVNRDLIARKLRGLDSQVKTILLLTAAGWTHKEIARQVGTTAEAVSSAVRRARHTMQAPSYPRP